MRLVTEHRSTRSSTSLGGLKAAIYNEVLQHLARPDAHRPGGGRLVASPVVLGVIVLVLTLVLYLIFA